MSDERERNSPTDARLPSRGTSREAARKLRAQRMQGQGVWFGLGMSGLIGWSVAVPTLLGALLGLWLDRRHPGSAFLDAHAAGRGIGVGCCNAWHWVAQEDKAMQDDRRTTMNEVRDRSRLALLAGVLLGAIFLRRALVDRFGRAFRPHSRRVWFFGSFLLRTAVAVGGFYFVARGDWQSWLACLARILVARIVVTRLTRMPLEKRATSTRQAAP